MGTYTPLDLNCAVQRRAGRLREAKGRSAHNTFAACPLRLAAMLSAV